MTLRVLALTCGVTSGGGLWFCAYEMWQVNLVAALVVIAIAAAGTVIAALMIRESWSFA